MYSDAKTTYTDAMLAMLQTISENFSDDNAILPAIDYCEEMGYDTVKWLLELLLKINPVKRSETMLFTGSRRYGKVHAESDFDWVLAYSKEECSVPEEVYKTPYIDNKISLIELLISRCETSQDEYGNEWPDFENYSCPQVDIAMRFGPINLILVHKRIQWNTWLYGTDDCLELKKRKGADYRLSREHAIALINREWSHQLNAYRSPSQRDRWLLEECSCSVSIKEVL